MEEEALPAWPRWAADHFSATALERSTDYELLERQVLEMIGEETDRLANAANFAAFIFHEIPDVTWAGFYYADASGDLVLGPFQGKPACSRLPKGRGICGAAFAQRRSIVVDDVAAFADHIACDAGARSEIVVPLLVDNSPYGVFDVDSARLARFSREDERGIECLVTAFVHAVGGGSPAR